MGLKKYKVTSSFAGSPQFGGQSPADKKFFTSSGARSELQSRNRTQGTSSYNQIQKNGSTVADTGAHHSTPSLFGGGGNEGPSPFTKGGY